MQSSCQSFFYRFCTTFELFEDKQRAKLGGADASKMHLLSQALCLTICSEILPYSNKTADSDAVFSKVSPWLFLQEIKLGKNTTSSFMEKKPIGQKMDTRGCRRAKRSGPTRLQY